MLEEEIRKIVKEEVRDEMRTLDHRLTEEMEKTLVAQREFLRKQQDALNVMMKTNEDIQARLGMMQPPKPAPAPTPIVEVEQEVDNLNDDEDTEVVEVPLKWVNEQKGNLDKGETQVWSYGEDKIVLWREGKRLMAKINETEPEELWRQKDLEKIQKRIEKQYE